MPYGSLPPELAEFLAAPRPAVLGCVRPDGSPVTTPTWYGWEDGSIYVCMSATGLRQRNLRADPRVALSVFGDSWYDHVSIRGTVVELRPDPDLVNADRLAVRYLGKASANRELDLVTARIEVLHWRTYGRPGGAVEAQPAPVCGKTLELSAVAHLVPRGATVMVGGFGLAGKPVAVVESLLSNPAVTDLTVISNNLGEPGRGLGLLLREGRIRRAVGSYFTSNPDVIAAHAAGDLEVELTPQGTMAEAIRAGGAGIAAFYVRTGAGTAIAGDRETRDLGGEIHVLWEALRADVALIRALRADDTLGNLVYNKSARNFNPDMATAADLVIAQVDEVVPVGELDPESIVTPHPLVDYVVGVPAS